MKQIRDKVGGLDVHRDSVVACTRVTMPTGEVEVAKERFPTTQAGLAALAGFLIEAGAKTVAMEATGIYWRTVYYALEGLFEELWLCNAAHVKNVPGRKTDLSDAEWLADVAAHGMVRPSFVPPPDIRELRELTRYRKTQVDARAKEIQRLEKILQDAGVKLTSVASTVWSKSSRAMIEAMIAGERDSAVLADLAKGKMRKKTDRLEAALESHFGAHHAILCRQVIDHLDFLDRSIATLSAEICERLVPFEPQVALLTSIPGISATTAQVIVAETGADMSRFPTAGHLCAWAGLAPASYESAGKKRPVGTRKGAPWLRRTLIEAARAAARTKGTYYSAQYSRLARRRGPNKAVVAVAHSMLDTAWHLLSTGALYQDPGADYFERRHDPAIEAKRLQRRIEALGFAVTIEEKAA
jgi:transposase